MKDEFYHEKPASARHALSCRWLYFSSYLDPAGPKSESRVVAVVRGFTATTTPRLTLWVFK